MDLGNVSDDVLMKWRDDVQEVAKGLCYKKVHVAFLEECAVQ